MLTKKLLAAVGLAGVLLLGVSTEASANPWHGSHFRPGPVYRAPVYRAAVYHTPVFVPAPRVVVYQPPVYAPAYTPVYAPVYRPIGWRHPHWVRYGHRW